jgi:hypothetical protein
VRARSTTADASDSALGITWRLPDDIAQAMSIKTTANFLVQVTCPEHEGAAVVYAALQRLGRVEATTSGNWNTEYMYRKLITAEAIDDSENEIQPGIWSMELSPSTQSDAQLYAKVRDYMCSNRVVYEIDVSKIIAGNCKWHLLIYAGRKQGTRYLTARLADVRALETRVRAKMKW